MGVLFLLPLFIRVGGGQAAPITFNPHPTPYTAPIHSDPSLGLIDKLNALQASIEAQKAKEAADALAAQQAAQKAADEAQAQKTALESVQTQSAAMPIQYTSSCSDPKSCIYAHESGNNPTKYNSTGCLGLGQACPASKLLVSCPTMDYACEDAWFTNYASKYGGWEGSWDFWQANGWW